MDDFPKIERKNVLQGIDHISSITEPDRPAMTKNKNQKFGSKLVGGVSISSKNKTGRCLAGLGLCEPDLNPTWCQSLSRIWI